MIDAMWHVSDGACLKELDFVGAGSTIFSSDSLALFGSVAARLTTSSTNSIMRFAHEAKVR